MSFTLHLQITEYLVENGLLEPIQASFRRFNSIQTVILRLTDDIRVGIHEKIVKFLLLLDFSKTFDTISPLRLIRKMKELHL